MYSGDESDLVEYVDHMGNDDAVCDAARVSMNKTSDLYTVTQNEKLIRYLAKHNHWSPFSHCTLKLRFKAPLFVARQLQKHQVGFAWNEISRRYVDTEPSFWIPQQFRKRAENVKQGSSQDTYEFNHLARVDLIKASENSLKIYNELITSGVCPEQARMFLPQNMMTEWIWTGSLYAWSRMYKLRIDPHAQFECQIYAKLVDEICLKYFPISWRCLNEVG